MLICSVIQIELSASVFADIVVRAKTEEVAYGKGSTLTSHAAQKISLIHSSRPLKP
jgi:hypothetical protein